MADRDRTGGQMRDKGMPRPINAETGEESDVELEDGEGLNYSARGRSPVKTAPVFSNAGHPEGGDGDFFDAELDGDIAALLHDSAQGDGLAAESLGAPEKFEPEAQPETAAQPDNSAHEADAATADNGKAKREAKTGRAKKETGKKRREKAAPDPETRKKSRRSAATALIISATTMALVVVVALGVTGRSAFLSKTLGSVLAPVQGAVSAITGTIQSKLSALGDNEELAQQYEAALQKIADTEIKTSRYDEVVAENERLRALMNNYEKYSQYEPMFARVIGKDTGNWFTTFTVDKGTADGVTANMTVMSSEGLVGRVVEVGLTYAKVTSIIDGSSGVAALIERNRDNGIIRGMVDDSTGEELLQMNYLPDVNDARTGDTVLTSGLDGIFPKGLPIGTVTQISRQSSGLSQYIVVTPYADFEHIEEVILLKAQTN